MKAAIIGKKVGMTQIFDEAGRVIPVTLIEAGPCVVVQKKTECKEGYSSVQFGYEEVSESALTKPEKGHLSKAGNYNLKYLHEFKLDNVAELNVGDIIRSDIFKEGDNVDITGISKGKGYQGVIKRHNAGRTPSSHGGGPVHRHAGSMVQLPILRKFLRERWGQGRWVMNRLLFKILMWFRLTPNLTCW